MKIVWPSDRTIEADLDDPTLDTGVPVRLYNGGKKKSRGSKEGIDKEDK